jgi:hypothetical protein
MRWFWKRRKPKLPKLKDDHIREDKILDRLDSGKVKGGRNRKNSIWNGCGGITPQ